MSVSVEGELTLRSAGVGPSCMLCPTLPRNNSSESTKNILLMMSAENLDTLKEQLVGALCLKSLWGHWRICRYSSVLHGFCSCECQRGARLRTRW